MSDEKTETFDETFMRTANELDATRFFRPAEEVAYFQARKHEDLTIRCAVRFVGFGQWEWDARQVKRYGLICAGSDTTREGAMVAAYTAAKELADGE